MQKIKLVLYYLEIFGAIFCVAKKRAFRNSPSTAAHPLPNGRDSFAVATIPCPKSSLYKQAKPQKCVDFAQNYSQKRVDFHCFKP